jgi:hypothetical protein
MAGTEGPPGEGDLPDVRGEPEPDWVESIRRGREERADRLRSLLGQAPREAAEGDAPPVENQPASDTEPEPPASVPEPPA